MTLRELKKIAEDNCYNWDYVLDVMADMESDGIAVNEEIIADMIYNGDI